MTSSRTDTPLTRRHVPLRFAAPPVLGLAVAVAFAAASPTAARASDDGLCFLSGVEIERGDRPGDRGVEMEVTCALADRRVLSVDSFDLRFEDGDRDLLTAGKEWYEAFQAEGGSFFSTQEHNVIEVEGEGRERFVELRAQTYAVPESDAVSLRGTIDLVAEADCVGRDAREPVRVRATAGALRNFENVEVPGGGTLRSVEQGQSGDDPMLGLSGAGSYLGLADPPEGVEEILFFGKKRVVVRADADPAATVELLVCPTEVVQLQVAIEADAR